MTPEQITVSILLGTFIIALVGYAVGLPLGVILAQLFPSMIGSAIGLPPLCPSLRIVEVGLLLPGIVAVALAASYLPAWRARRESVVDALRHE